MKREKWIDYIKTIACLAVVLGHLLQSMVKANIIEETILYGWFMNTIYYFHVPCFFIASGYLHQKSTKFENTYFKVIGIKILNLGIPYVTFTCITFFLKMIFKNDVNVSYDKTVLHYLLFEPISPYWFLHTLLLCYIFFPVVKRKKQIYVYLLIAGIMQFSNINILPILYQPIKLFIGSAIFFVMGIAISYFNIKEVFERKWIWISVLFIPITIITYGKVKNPEVEFLISCLGILFIIFLSLQINYSGKLDLNRYFFHIYLLHTIFAAGMRAALFKLGIYNFFIHMMMGILASVVFPIVVGKLANKSSFLNFFFNPYCVIKKIMSSK